MPLINIIQALINESQQTGRPSRRKLPNGLHICLTNRAAAYTLILSRDKAYPSEQEWKTVLKHWPYKTEPITPARLIDSNRRMALKADIPTARACLRA